MILAVRSVSSRRRQIAEPSGCQFRLSNMGPPVATHDPESDHLRAEYDHAFHEWAAEVSRRQEIGEISEGAEEADTRVAAAEILYRDSRDRLTEGMSLRAADTEQQ